MSDLKDKQNDVNTVDQRLYYMDNVRAFAMMLGIFFHAAIAYTPFWHNIWFVADPQQSMLIDVVAFFSHTFRMPLFFVVAGFFALMILEKRGVKPFLVNRSKRILLPLVIFLPLVSIAFIAAIIWGASYVENMPPILSLMGGMEDQEAKVSTAHLWFLFNLFGFCVVAAILFKLRMLQSSILNKLASPLFILVALPILLTPTLYTLPGPFIAPDRPYPQLWAYSYYGLFFLTGCALYRKTSIMERLEKFEYLFLIAGLLSLSVAYNLVPNISVDNVLSLMNNQPISNSGLTHLLASFVQAVCAVYFSFYFLVLGKRLLNKSSKILRYIADSSYWIYIVHLPILLFIQFLLIDVNMLVGFKLAISIAGTMAIGFISYWYLVRFSFVGKLLNGKKYQRNKADTDESLAATS